jgi:hypothetical protein
LSQETATRGRLAAIRNLAVWVTPLRQKREEEAIQADASVLKPLIDAVRLHATQAIEEFRETIKRSVSMLSPLGEPLVVLDFTEHRWVAVIGRKPIPTGSNGSWRKPTWQKCCAFSEWRAIFSGWLPHDHPVCTANAANCARSCGTALGFARRGTGFHGRRNCSCGFLGTQ